MKDEKCAHCQCSRLAFGCHRYCLLHYYLDHRETPQYKEKMKFIKENRHLYLVSQMDFALKNPLQYRIDNLRDKLVLLMIDSDEMDIQLGEIERNLNQIPEN